jgi:hypothetical protein
MAERSGGDYRRRSDADYDGQRSDNRMVFPLGIHALASHGLITEASWPPAIAMPSRKIPSWTV